MDRDSSTIVDAGDGSLRLEVSMREESGGWPESVSLTEIQENNWTGDIVLLPGAVATRRFIRALQRKSKAFRGAHVPQVTKIGRTDSSIGLELYVQYEPTMIFVQQEGDIIAVESEAQMKMLTEAIKGYAAVLGWEVD